MLDWSMTLVTKQHCLGTEQFLRQLKTTAILWTGQDMIFIGAENKANENIFKKAVEI